MTNGEAYEICKDIKFCQRSDDDKGLAIHIMMNMETHNGITKKDLLDIVQYLHELCFDVEGEE